MLTISYTSLTNRSPIMRLGFVNFTHYLHEFVKFPKAECIFKLIGLYATGKTHYMHARQRHNTLFERCRE